MKVFLERSNGRIYSCGPFEPVLEPGRWNCPTGRRQSGVPIPRYSTSNSLRKLLKNFLERSNGQTYIYGPFDPVL